MQSASLFYKDARSNKIYTVKIEPDGTTFRVLAFYGPNGGTMQMAQKGVGLTLEAATKKYQSCLQEKIAKGYQYGENSGPVQTPTSAAVDSSLPAHMLLREVPEEDALALLEDDSWLAQPKADGVRCRLTKHADGSVTGLSRTNKPVTLPQVVVDHFSGKPLAILFETVSGSFEFCGV